MYDNAQRYHVDRVSVDGGGSIDQALGKTAQQLKDVGGQAADWRARAGAAAHQGLQNAESGAGHAAGVLANVASNPGQSVAGVVSNPGKVIGLGLANPPPAQPLSAPLRVGKMDGHAAGFALSGGDLGRSLDNSLNATHHAASDLTRRVEMSRRLDRLLRALDQEHIVRRQHSGGRISELRVRLDRSLAHQAGNGETVVTFAVQASGFQYDFDPTSRKGIRPRHSSDFKIGAIHIQGASGGRPQARVVLASLSHSSIWDANELLRDQLLKAIERSWPNATESDRFEERKLAVYNRGHEPIRVWVQVESKQGGGWHWVPAGPGPKAASYTYVIAPRKLTVLNRDRQGDVLTGRRAHLGRIGIRPGLGPRPASGCGPRGRAQRAAQRSLLQRRDAGLCLQLLDPQAAFHLP